MLGLLFMSSMAMPRDLIQEDWFKTIATYNPISYLIEAARSLFINGWDAEALALGAGIAAVALDRGSDRLGSQPQTEERQRDRPLPLRRAAAWPRAICGAS